VARDIRAGAEDEGEESDEEAGDNGA